MTALVTWPAGDAAAVQRRVAADVAAVERERAGAVEDSAATVARRVVGDRAVVRRRRPERASAARAARDPAATGSAAELVAGHDAAVERGRALVIEDPATREVAHP